MSYPSFESLPPRPSADPSFTMNDEAEVTLTIPLDSEIAPVVSEALNGIIQDEVDAEYGTQTVTLPSPEEIENRIAERKAELAQSQEAQLPEQDAEQAPSSGLTLRLRRLAKILRRAKGTPETELPALPETKAQPELSEPVAEDQTAEFLADREKTFKAYIKEIRLAALSLRGTKAGTSGEPVELSGELLDKTRTWLYNAANNTTDGALADRAKRTLRTLQEKADTSEYAEVLRWWEAPTQ